jgi:ribosomal protein S18 acetylase RimI-like enzyme
MEDWSLQNNNATQLQILPYQTSDQIHIRHILESIGWDEHYILAFEQAATHFAQNSNTAVYMAHLQTATIGFVFVEYHAWNRLAQIQGLAVDSTFHRQGAASALVAQAENFAHAHQARGIYVDTPTTNDRGRRFYEAIGYQIGYIMPRYYEDKLDGITYQKFFDEKAV